MYTILIAAAIIQNKYINKHIKLYLAMFVNQYLSMYSNTWIALFCPALYLVWGSSDDWWQRPVQPSCTTLRATLRNVNNAESKVTYANKDDVDRSWMEDKNNVSLATEICTSRRPNRHVMFASNKDEDAIGYDWEARETWRRKKLRRRVNGPRDAANANDAAPPAT